ncbi:uncharacterized protein N7515_001880 [Penicillium bovifimosum]|uniref:HTH psq-type domain-containing protein n=1 Tax=Penicillium bovifimosum TaxID=126998 RepID=A0A9W9HCG9_9EURO|nr:uncharacterized protein N7515_001880 [Penicillium bovifimosum]KAJ5143093.1 hypothetical protein N7515_001880 [Penicillium bovifimosum]
MPPIRGKKAQKSVDQEGKILLAIKAIKNGRATSVSAAARFFEVPRSTLQARLKGRTSCRYSRKYDYQRAVLEDPNVIIEWFKLVEKTIAQYGITSDDIYNFDESGFAMGVSATTKVITQSVYTGRRGVLQPGNREWVTVVETICASGRALPPYVIFKGKRIMERWLSDLPTHWTVNDTSFRNHLTPEFDKIGQENDIVPIRMPPHASHLLQPLDVGCFAVLKRSYGGRVAEYTRLGIDSIEKNDFLQIFPEARNDAFKEPIVKSAFAATGLVPLDPDRVLSKLTMRLQSPRLPDRPVSQGSTSGSNISTGVPRTAKQLAKRKARIDSGLSSAADKINSPTKADLQQYHNMAVKLVHDVVCLRDKLERSLDANRKQNKKKSLSNKQLVHKGSITANPAPPTDNPTLSLHSLFYPLCAGKSPVLCVVRKGIR